LFISKSGKFKGTLLQGKTAKRTRKAWALFMLAIGLPEPRDGVAKVHATFLYGI
jgi:hypothetical protein